MQKFFLLELFLRIIIHIEWIDKMRNYYASWWEMREMIFVEIDLIIVMIGHYRLKTTMLELYDKF